MGEVYYVRDPRLGRSVALKILSGGFTSDPDRVKRFEREARMLAALNHPNIAIIHGVEDAQGVSALVMELVDGETLAERIAADQYVVSSFSWTCLPGPGCAQLPQQPDACGAPIAGDSVGRHFQDVGQNVGGLIPPCPTPTRRAPRVLRAWSSAARVAGRRSSP